jgi:polar amino acid transport system substrate-binding protein
MKRTFAALMLCATTAVGIDQAFSAESPVLPERIATARKVRIAVNAGFPPMEMREPKTNEIVGFDIDLGNAITQELGLATEWVDGVFEQMIPSLISKRVDLIMSGMSDLSERQKTVDFIDYLTSGEQVYAMTNGPINAVGDLCGQKVSVSQGTSTPEDLTNWSNKNCVANGKEAVKVVLDNNLGQQIINLTQGRAVASVQSVEGIDRILQDQKGAMKIVGTPIVASHAGIAFRKEDTQLRDAYLWALKKKFADGTYAKLLEKWNLRAAAYPEPTINNSVE